MFFKGRIFFFFRSTPTLRKINHKKNESSFLFFFLFSHFFPFSSSIETYPKNICSIFLSNHSRFFLKNVTFEINFQGKNGFFLPLSSENRLFLLFSLFIFSLFSFSSFIVRVDFGVLFNFPPGKNLRIFFFFSFAPGPFTDYIQ